jgi:cell division protein FtsL
MVAGMALALFVSAVVAVYTQHRSRQLFVERQELRREEDKLNIQWGRLRLEQGTWATHARIERLAREELELTMPHREDVVFLELDASPSPGGDDGR